MADPIEGWFMSAYPNQIPRYILHSSISMLSDLPKIATSVDPSRKVEQLLLAQDKARRDPFLFKQSQTRTQCRTIEF